MLDYNVSVKLKVLYPSGFFFHDKRTTFYENDDFIENCKKL